MVPGGGGAPSGTDGGTFAFGYTARSQCARRSAWPPRAGGDRSIRGTANAGRTLELSFVPNTGAGWLAWVGQAGTNERRVRARVSLRE